jgi:tryptophanyl-tRNA synthetase
MSKSEDASNHAIGLLDAPDAIRAKIARATTDSLKEIRFDESRPGIYNLLTIYQTLTGENQKDIEARWAGKGYSEFKKALAEIVIESLRPLQERYKTLTADPYGSQNPGRGPAKDRVGVTRFFNIQKPSPSTLRLRSRQALY